MIDPGAGYTANPGIAFVGVNTNPGVGAAATTRISDNTVGIVTVTSGGGGYVTAPLLRLVVQVLVEQLLLVSLLYLLPEQFLQSTSLMLVLDIQLLLQLHFQIHLLLELEHLLDRKLLQDLQVV